MKVKSSKKQYRNAVLGLEKKIFNDYRSGKVIEITKGQYDKNPAAYIETKEVKDGRI